MKVRILIQVDGETLADVDEETDERGRVDGRPVVAVVGDLMRDLARRRYLATHGRASYYE